MTDEAFRVTIVGIHLNCDEQFGQASGIFPGDVMNVGKTPEAATAEVSGPVPTDSLPAEPQLADISGQDAPTGPSSAPLGDTPLQTPVAQRLPRQVRVLYSGTAGAFIALGAQGQASWEHDGERFQSRLSAGLSTPDSSLDFRSTGRLIGPRSSAKLPATCA